MVAALVTMLAVNALFVALFDYSPPPPAKVPVKPFRTMMLDLSSPQRHWYHDVGKWFHLQNPSLASRPDYEFGYSRYARRAPYRTILPPQLPVPPALIVPMQILPFNILYGQRYPSAAASRAELQGLRTIDPRAVDIVYPKTEPVSYPLAVSNGVPLRNIHFGAVDVPADSAPTRVRLSAGEAGMLPRAVVVGSSGNAGLDREAVRALLEYANRSPLQPGSSHELIIYWQKEGSAS